MSEPTTPTGKRLTEELAGTGRQPDILAIEAEAAAMGQHTNCLNEWAWRAKMSPGIQMTMHDWSAHLGKGFDHD